MNKERLTRAAERAGLTTEAVVQLIEAQCFVGEETILTVEEPLADESHALPESALDDWVASREDTVVSKSKLIHGLPRYEDLGPLSSGAMGQARRVRDRRLGRTLALRTLSPSTSMEGERLRRFLDEARVTSQLQHPGIMPVYDIGELPDGRLWYTMKEVSGRTLADVVTRAEHAVGQEGTDDFDPASPIQARLRRVVDILRRVAETIAYAHERGVIHRDLQPDKVMVGKHDEVVVLDWGLSTIRSLEDAVRARRDALTNPSAQAESVWVDLVSGAHAYLAPELLRDEDIGADPRLDVYSLGAMLYHLLSGESPNEDAPLGDTLLRLLAGPPTEASSGRDSSSERRGGNWHPTEPAGSMRWPLAPLVATCERAMARELDQRMDSASRFAGELSDWLDGARRREEALSIVEQARDIVPHSASLRHRASVLRAESEEALAQVEAWQPEGDKATGWALADAAADLDRRAEQAELEAELLLQSSLTHAPDLAEVHEALAARYRAEHVACEAANKDTMRAEALLRQHAEALPQDSPTRASHLNYLRGHGALTLVTNPPGARVSLYRYEPRNRRLAPRFVKELGITPLYAVSVPMGSFLCLIEHSDRPPVRYPIQIKRNEHWDGVPPGSTSAQPVLVPSAEELGTGVCYVPAGWFRAGGGELGAGSTHQLRLWSNAFVIARAHVTNSEYLEFLHDLIRTDDMATALRAAPRERVGAAGEEGELVYHFNGERFSLGRDSDGAVQLSNGPVVMVDWFGVAAYCDWRSKRDGLAWRVPVEWEWEKAARGVDGRRLPWGDFFDAAWANTRFSKGGEPSLDAVGSYPHDASPYGVHDVAGNAKDWCARVDEALMADGRVPTSSWSLDSPPTIQQVARGGGCSSFPSHTDTIGRLPVPIGLRSNDQGFRPIRSFEPSG